MEVILVSVWGFMDVYKLHPKFDLILDRFDIIQKEIKGAIDKSHFDYYY